MTEQMHTPTDATKLTEGEWRTLEEFRRDWSAFCDADPVGEDFSERMEAAGYIELRSVTADDLDDPFAYERGIVPDGSVWSITPAGRAALSQQVQS